MHCEEVTPRWNLTSLSSCKGVQPDTTQRPNHRELVKSIEYHRELVKKICCGLSPVPSWILLVVVRVVGCCWCFHMSCRRSRGRTFIDFNSWKSSLQAYGRRMSATFSPERQYWHQCWYCKRPHVKQTFAEKASELCISLSMIKFEDP